MTRFFTYCHYGDLGDLIYQLPAMTPAGDLCLYSTSPRTVREPFTAAKVESVKPYLEFVTHGKVFFARNPPKQDRNSDHIIRICDGWRRKYKRGVNLQQQLYNYFQIRSIVNHREIPHDKAWLAVDRIEHVANVVFHRSPRYPGDNFPWRTIVERWGKEAVFVGSAEEHLNFKSEFGEVPYHHTPTIFDLARVLAGAHLFVGNQSMPRAIAEGLKVNVFVEEWTHDPNTHFTRPNAWYGRNDFDKVELAASPVPVRTSCQRTPVPEVQP